MEVILHRSRRTREKKCASWERYVYETDGVFMYRAARIALRYPSLTPTDTREIVYSILSNSQRQRFENNWQLDFAYQIPGQARFRVPVPSQELGGW